MSNKHGSKWIRPEKRLAIYSRDGFACAYCADEESLSLDHLHPRELGGSHDAENLITSCVTCNSARRDLPLQEWFAMLRDRGGDTRRLGKKIRALTSKPIDIDEGKRLLAARRGK